MVAALCLTQPALAEPFQRTGRAAGSVIDRKTGEEVRFVDLSNWQNVALHQDLLGGDVLRTNANGQLAILFADHTQVRLGRNSALQVKQMAADGDTVLNLQSGTMWARAQRGGQGLTVETPAAAAAIRGTDWTLTVKGDQTSLIVLEGRVEFKNEHGSVEVAQGEAAVATIGQAPRKLVIVTPDDREQMLFYLTLRSGFTFMPASPLPMQKMRSERSRIEAKAPEARTAEDWLTLAEVQMSFDGRQQALKSLAKARALKLSASQLARADLIEALIAGSEKRYDDAAKLFSRAEPGLDPQRRSIAAYGGYYSRSLRDPDHVERPPSNVTGPYAAVMKAYTAGFLEDIPAAIRTMKEAESRFPTDSSLPALRAQLALLINDRVQMKEAIERSLSIDPNDPDGLQARARYRADFEGNLEAALKDLNNAIKVAPGSSMAWNDLGLLQAARGASREAEAALKKAIELDPDDPISHANLAVLYLDQSRMKEAKREIDLALAADPAFDVALLARGRYYLQSGEQEKAIDDLLAASTANPSYSQAQLMLAAGHYERGERDPSNQAVENADRLDKNDPVISAFRTAVAIDDYDADGAIANAQEFLRRARARGGDFSALGANQDAGSTLNNAFRLQGLDAWGRYYGDAVFDPFEGSGFADQALKGSINPFKNAITFGDSVIENTSNATSFSSLFQGLLLDPHMLSGRSRSATLLRTPFIEGSLGGGINSVGGHTGRVAEAEIQGFSNETIPISFFGNFEWEEIPAEGDYADFGNFSTETKLLNANGYITATPTPDDRVVAFVNQTRSDFDLNSLTLDPSPSTRLNDELFIPLFGVPVAPPELPFYRTQQNSLDNLNSGVGWSHTFGYRNIVNAALLYSKIKSESTNDFVFDQSSVPFLGGPPPDLVPFGQTRESLSSKSYVAAISHSLGTDNGLTWRYGVEGGWIDTHRSSFAELFELFPLGIVPDITSGPDDASSRTNLARAYVDLLHEITPDLTAEYALHATRLDGDGADVSRLEPRLGVAWAPIQDQWLRAAFMRQSVETGVPTLAPIGIVGLQPNQIAVGLDGYVDTVALQWDSQWTDRFFTSMGYQHQELHDMTIGLPLTALPAIDSLPLERGSIERASITANVALGNGFGLSATYARMESENKDETSANFGGALPFIPRNSGQVALTWVNEAKVKATIAANYIGKRDGDDIGTELDDFWTLDANMIWEPFDKRFALEVAAFNLLDEDFEITPGVPGWGRAVKGTLKVRF
ncbi:TPR repeat-containing protein [Rhizobium mesoamericanum STM3625]|uniref:TPR repeat-containing protein n=2 Tax=Rhizobium mesoamericanum TaxID=1079800 RepID=K0Q572_9HYPH|nr:FecR domain-containing protein [Rhizobium mesoamericanum]CCM78229.1 TPR repeat-containing protein [Rhizobium mesoamericanum STM3625]